MATWGARAVARRGVVTSVSVMHRTLGKTKMRMRQAPSMAGFARARHT